MLQNEQGLSKLLIIVGLVLVLGLGFAAFMVRDNKGGNPANQSPEENLVIKEWNVQFPMPEGSRDLYYTMITYRGVVGQGVKIYSKDIDELQNAKGVACKDALYPLFVISRVNAARGVQMNNPHSPDYDPTSGTYKVYDFEKEYAFGGSHDDKRTASCVNLNAGTSGKYQEDSEVLKKYKEKIQAIRQGYTQLKAVPKSQ